MIRISIRFAAAGVLAILSLPVFSAIAQQPQTAAPSAPAPAATPVFPQPNPLNFTATSPSKEVVNAFLQANWGFDEDHVWEVWAIQKTPAEGVSKVLILLQDRSGKQKPAVVQFFVLPDGKHALTGNDVIPFGEHPYAEYRAMLQQRADGPYRGSAVKNLELVEFADFQCPHCKEAQANMDKLAVDFPKARIIFENFPLSIHPESSRAAAYGFCVARQGGSDAFFTFSDALFDGQEGLSTADGATLTLNSAVTKVGLDPAKIAACAATSLTADAVQSSVKLAQDLDINQTPILMVNGRAVAANAPYDTLKKIILYQAKMDGVTAQ